MSKNQFMTSYRNEKLIEGSPDNSPDNSPETELTAVPPAIKYIIYCHGEIVNETIIIPYLENRRAFTLEYLVDDFNILSSNPYNMINICNSDYIPRTILKSGFNAYNMNLTGGVAIGVDLGIYVCRELNNPTIISNFTENGIATGVTYATTLPLTIAFITFHHRQTYSHHPLRIIMHTCRVAQDVPTPIQSMTLHFVDDDLSSNLNNMNIQDNNEMDTSGGKKKSKTSRIKKNKKTKKTKKNKKIKKTKNNKKLRK